MTATLTRPDLELPLREQPAAKTAIADPAALGLGAFAMTTFVLSLANAGLIPEAGFAVLALAFFYGGIAQIIVGVIEFFKGNVFGATAFTSYGMFWMGFWWIESNPEIAAAVGSVGMGVYLLGWTLFTIYMTIASLKTNGVLVTVFTVLCTAFVALTIGAFTGNQLIHELGGWLGLVTAALAAYGSCAVVTNATWKREVLPMWAK
ncbi:hypothetical protein GT020_11455 [Glutamicibacter soli]|uniref:Uncharacterized protein n=1 Tax=Glutamicibacter soli TaxID=453836 RepID=A0A6L9G456_9MICC|nr:GPR1/FUN34/YaaH family transporter [Glutamicibacter soli]NAZ16672.1 hypothetical protein [Glutamicibacter soli]